MCVVEEFFLHNYIIFFILQNKHESDFFFNVHFNWIPICTAKNLFNLKM